MGPQDEDHQEWGISEWHDWATMRGLRLEVLVSTHNAIFTTIAGDERSQMSDLRVVNMDGHWQHTKADICSLYKTPWSKVIGQCRGGAWGTEDKKDDQLEEGGILRVAPAPNETRIWPGAESDWVPYTEEQYYAFTGKNGEKTAANM